MKSFNGPCHVSSNILIVLWSLSYRVMSLERLALDIDKKSRRIGVNININKSLDSQSDASSVNGMVRK